MFFLCTLRMLSLISTNCKALSPVLSGYGFYYVEVHKVFIFSSLLLIFEIKFTRRDEKKKIITNAHKLCNFVFWNAIWIALYVIVLSLKMGCPFPKKIILLYTLSVMPPEEKKNTYSKMVKKVTSNAIKYMNGTFGKAICTLWFPYAVIYSHITATFIFIRFMNRHLLFSEFICEASVIPSMHVCLSLPFSNLFRLYMQYAFPFSNGKFSHLYKKNWCFFHHKIENQ